MLGTMFTPNRDRAKLIGFGVHFLNGWIFASVYAAAFESWRRATWWLGAAIGLVHALYVLVAAMPALPAIHPRMANEQQGPRRPGNSNHLASWPSTTAGARRSR